MLILLIVSCFTSVSVYLNELVKERPKLQPCVMLADVIMPFDDVDPEQARTKLKF